MTAQLGRLPRRLLRKIVVERSSGGWVARIVGFDARFFSKATSPEYPTRAEAVRAAEATSRICGLPVVTAESLVAAGGPEAAA